MPLSLCSLCGALQSSSKARGPRLVGGGKPRALLLLLCATLLIALCLRLRPLF
jgi:hypothetical protein